MQNRPVYINIFTYAFPISAIVSILHRLSGVVVFLFIPQLLGMLQDVLYFPWVSVGPSKILIWFALTALLYHLFAGIRHLCMDAGFGEEKPIAMLTSYVVLFLTILFSLLLGLRIC